MPLYEYECAACGHRFEVIQKFSEPPLDRCPKCGDIVHKLQSAPAFHLKGSGWYITDYAKKDQGGPSKSESGSTEAAAGDKKDGDGDKGDKQAATGDKKETAAKTEKSSEKSSSTPAKETNS